MKMIKLTSCEKCIIKYSCDKSDETCCKRCTHICLQTTLEEREDQHYCDSEHCYFELNTTEQTHTRTT